MKTLIYVPVYIKGKKKNLPKKDGIYFIGIKNPTDLNFKECKVWIWRTTTNAEMEKEKIKCWLKNIEYWLKPVEIPDEEEAKIAVKNTFLFETNIARIAWMKCYDWFKSQILKE